MVDPVLTIVARLALAGLFAAALGHKLREPAAFRATVAAYQLGPATLMGPLAIVVVVTECAVLLGLVVAAPWAPALAGVTLATYASALAVNLVRGRVHLDCGCVGSAGRGGLSWWLVGRNLVAVGVAAGLWLPSAGRALVWIDGVTIAGLLATVTALFAATDWLLANRAAVARVREGA
jgi:hypothetical protein